MKPKKPIKYNHLPSQRNSKKVVSSYGLVKNAKILIQNYYILGAYICIRTKTFVLNGSQLIIYIERG